MASNSDHMEYSTWRIFGVLWSASGSTPFDYIYCHMKYSIWSIFDATWSTPCGHYFLPYGVLHIIAIHVNCGRDAKSSIRLVFSALESTPYGLESPPYGALHMTLLWCHIEWFTINSK